MRELIGPSSCATSTIVAPRWERVRSASARTCWLGRSTPAVGSSRGRISGPPAAPPLLLPAGQGGPALAGAVGEPDHVERVGDRGAVGAAERTQQPAPG